MTRGSKRKKIDVRVGVIPMPDREAVWPRRFLDCTPTLGWTPVLDDESSLELSKAARSAAERAFGSGDPAPPADARGSVP